MACALAPTVVERRGAPRSRRLHVLRMALFTLLGALAGYGYHRLVGCQTGACPITASPTISTLYGAVVGALMTPAA